MLAEAKREAERIVKEARERQEQLVSQQEVTRQAERAAEDIIEDARAREREIRLGAEDYADEILNTLEVNLSKFIAAVQRGRERLQGRDEPAEVGQPHPAPRCETITGDRRAPAPDRALAHGPRRRSTDCSSCTARTWRGSRTRTSRCSWGRPARSTRPRWPRGCCADGRGGYCFELNTVLAALLRGCGFVVTHHQAVVGGEGPTNHMALLVHLDGERWLADAGLGEGFVEPLPFREGTTELGPFTYTLTREDGGSWWMGQHEWSSFSGFRMTEEESRRGGLRPPPPPAGHRPRVELRQDARGPEPAAGPDRHAARPHALGDRPGGRRQARDRSRGVRRRCCATSSGSRSAANGWSACGTQAAAQHEAFLAARPDARRHPPRQLPRRRRLRRRRARRSSTASSSSSAPATTRALAAADVARRHRRALGPRGRRLRPPPARRRRRARQRHPLRELRPRLARVRRALAGGERTRRRDRRAARAGRRRQRHRPDDLDARSSTASAR